jgi:AbiV family abortive infection protein
VQEANEGMADIVVSLCVFAFEEIGKAEIAAVSAARSPTVEEASAWMSRHARDHVEKLFWAIWGPSFGRELITERQVNDSRAFAIEMHMRRLEALYTSLDPEASFQGATEREADNLITLLEARLSLARELRTELDSDSAERAAWFFEATEDPDRRSMLFSRSSMEKLVELGGVPAWIDWLQEQFAEAERVGQEQLEAELARDTSAAPGQDKWRLRVRFESASHSVRSGPLNWWNRISTRLRLSMVPTHRNSLDVELTLTDEVSAQDLWPAFLGATQKFLVALNIGTLGFFWWELAGHRDRFYERLRDIQTDADVEMTRRIGLPKWGRQALRESDLRSVALVLSQLPRAGERDAHPIFGEYLTGLALVAKSDVHLDFGGEAFKRFATSLRQGLAYYDSLEAQASAVAVLKTRIGDVLEALPSDAMALVQRLDGNLETPVGKLDEAATLKVIADAYFLRTFRRFVAEQREPRPST